jgi:hypothetical protein
VTTKVDAKLYKDVYEFWKPKAQAVHDTTGANVTFVFQPVPKSVAQASKKKGGNAMGIQEVDQMCKPLFAPHYLTGTETYSPRVEHHAGLDRRSR